MFFLLELLNIKKNPTAIPDVGIVFYIEIAYKGERERTNKNAEESAKEGKKRRRNETLQW
jgi:hypothetical protein